MTHPNRPPVHEWFLGLAVKAAERGTCLRAQVGCVLARGNRLLVLGYVGSRPGEPHCLDEGCVIGETGGCTRTKHAEANALEWAEKLGIDVRGATAYVTLSPCVECADALLYAGIAAVYYLKEYRLSNHLDALRSQGVVCSKIELV